MPHTLVHLGTQALVTRGVWRRAPLLWVYLGGVLPDLPWILQRIVKAMAPGIDLATLRLYAVAQGSLLGCLVLAAAVSALARDRWRVLALLGGGAALHLLLDAVEVKWGVGVVLLAPFDWRPLQLGWLWPESVPAAAWTLVAGLFVVWTWREAASEDPGVSWSRRGLMASIALGALWLLLPLALAPGAWRSDAHFVRTLDEVALRPGRAIELHRAHAFERPGADVVETLEREVLVLRGLEVEGKQRVSIRGRFVDAQTIRVEDSFVHARGWRDAGSYVGLAVVGVLWGGWAWRSIGARGRGARKP